MSLVQSDTHVLNFNRPFAQRFCFLVKLGFLLFKPQWDYQNLNMKGKTKRIPIVCAFHLLSL